MDQVVSTLRSRMRNGCTGCSYCMPCPAGVKIPDIFDRWNTYHIYQDPNLVKTGWKNMKDEHKPVSCIECGACEAACPQHLNIREDLKLAQKDLDGLL